MLRCGQININERDAATLDIEGWMDYELTLKVDVVILNGGGIDCYYPTKVPYHRHYKFIGTRDLFGDMCTTARKRKLRVIARMDPNYAYEEAFEAHPEWF
jgi:hypothetical protein